MYLLDTNIISDLIRRPQGPVRRRMGEVGVEKLFVNPVIAGELLFGAQKKQSPRLLAEIEGILLRMNILPLDNSVVEAYADIRLSLESAGTPIGANDLWIAAHARAEDLTLVTANEGEFARVPGLRVENWLTP